jgi:hypothetical protein
MTIIDFIVQGIVWTFAILVGLFGPVIIRGIRLISRIERRKAKAEIRRKLALERKAQRAELKLIKNQKLKESV